ncbi:hypothetical protein NOCA2330007 [metagenome]|uniref:Uncharacterized protein n=1 Tax=metagenome TaxID=256318 RepID=A0A2P2C2Q3_9ZZZZ
MRKVISTGSVDAAHAVDGDLFDEGLTGQHGGLVELALLRVGNGHLRLLGWVLWCPTH